LAKPSMSDEGLKMSVSKGYSLTKYCFVFHPLSLSSSFNQNQKKDPII
jgi:hypothetical protein